MKFAGKTAVATSGAMGIDWELAEGLAAEGAHIAIADRDKPKRQTNKHYVDQFVDL